LMSGVRVRGKGTLIAKARGGRCDMELIEGKWDRGALRSSIRGLPACQCQHNGKMPG
jgi:hypothetical protein